MPIYAYACPHCGAVREEIRTMERRNDPTFCVCVPGAVAMVRSEVYCFRTATNEASRWPYVSHALVPQDPNLRARYEAMGRMTEDGAVRIESPADYARVTREQGVKPLGEYERMNLSASRPTGRKKAKAERRAKLKERIAEKIRAQGVGMG